MTTAGSRKRVALIVDRCGEPAMGGAEGLCLSLAEKLGGFHDVEVLTSCARDYRTWRNELAEGVEVVRGVPIRRFPVDRERDPARFHFASWVVRRLGKLAPVIAQEAWMREQGPYSTRMLAFLAREAPAYDAVFFIGYLYATTYFCLPLVASKGILVPLAHDEWMLELRLFDRVFRHSRTIAFVAREERDLVVRRFPAFANAGNVIGVGVDSPKIVDARRFREEFGISGPFAIYLGRVDRAKGVEILFDYVRRLPTSFGFSLVCVGEQYVDVPVHPRIRAVGAVTDQTKWDALAACDFVVMPSETESLSLALLEAWSAGKPALVNARSPVLVAQCRRSGGGIAYSSFPEFERAAAAIAANGAALGALGQRFVCEEYTWSRVTPAYLALIDSIAGGSA